MGRSGPNKVKVSGGCCFLYLGDCKKCCADPVLDGQQCSNSAMEQRSKRVCKIGDFGMDLSPNRFVTLSDANASESVTKRGELEV